MDQVEDLRRRIEAAPRDVDLHLELGELLRARNDLDGARAMLQSALDIDPADVRVLRHIARTEGVARNWPAAERHIRAALAIKPTDPKLVIELANCLLRQVRFAEASDALRAALRKRPDHAGLHSRLGYILRLQGANDEAKTHLLRAIELEPKDAGAMVEMSMIHEELGDFEPALVWHRRAADIKGESYAATSFCSALLAAGRSGKEAWGMNRHRVEYPAFAALPAVRVWQGEPLHGKSIFVVTEGGAGDQIRDACCFRELADRAARVTVTIEPRFIKLYARSFPTIRFLPMPRQERVAPYERMLSRLIDEAAFADIKAHDYATLSPDLFYFFRESNDQWGRQQAYFVAAPELVDKWRARLAALGAGPKVGISWRSQPNFNRVFYHTELTEWDPILTRPGAHFINLQYDESEDELRAAEEKFGIRIHRWDDLDLRNDFDNIAGLVANLDAVLAPNTAILEFAGALGVTAFYMNRVPVAYDHWRRKDATGQDRLYPSVTQIRGHKPYDTPALIDAVAAALWSRLGRGRVWHRVRRYVRGFLAVTKAQG